MSGLAVEDVTVRVGEQAILSGVACAAPAGAITALIGPNGAGKSTLIAAILGQRSLATGRIRFGDADITTLPPAERARLAAHVEQSATTTERLNVRDVVALGRIPFQSGWRVPSDPAEDVIIDTALDEMGVTSLSQRLYHTLSGGEAQRVQIARALAQRPRLLLLDEPTSHLDVQAQLLVLDRLRRLANAGCTVLLALHDLNLAARLADHLIVLGAGAVAAEGAPAAVLEPGLLRAVYGVEARVLRLPDTPYPVVIYDRPAAGPSRESG